MITTSTQPQPIEYPDSDGMPMADNSKQFRWIVTIEGNVRWASIQIPLDQNCPKKRKSFFQNSRMSSIAYLSIVMRCGPMPKAKPLTWSGS